MVEDELDAWRCQICRQLIYNVEHQDGATYPVPGAPPANFYSDEFRRLCTLCADMIAVSDTDYFKRLDEEHERRMSEYRRNY